MDHDLVARAAGCTRCALSATRHHVVVGSGSLGSRLVLVGEAPGAAEDAGGEPFIGRSGRLLFELIASELDLTRDQCYVTNVVKCRPPANRTPRAAELEACRPWWLEQRRAVGAAVIVTLGNTATRAVLDTREPISTLRGRAVALDDAVVVPTFHPAAAVRGGPNVVAMMRADLLVVAHELALRSP